MKKYKILDTETTRDFAIGLIGKEYYGEKENNFIKLFTDDGELLFASDEVKEIK